MTVLGGFIHKVGLINIAKSALEIDAVTTLFQPMNGHAGNKPLSLNWFFPLLWRETSASDSNDTSRQYAPVAGELRDCTIFVTTSTTDGTRLIHFRVNGSGTLAVTVTGATTGSFTALDLDIAFAKGARLNYRYFNGDAGSGNLTFQCTSVIRWF